MNYTIQQIRQAWLAAALDEWNNPRGVDPKRDSVRDDDRGKEGDRDIIGGYFAANGWRAWLDNETGGGYRETPRTSWCGQFQSAMSLRIGDYIKPGECVPLALDADVARMVLVSTSRLASRAKWNAAGSHMPVYFRQTSVENRLQRSDNGTLAAADAVLLPGVLATVKTSGRKPDVGDHIVLIESYNADAGTVDTVEGNGRGTLGDGSYGEGVVRTTRDFADIRRVYPLDLAVFETFARP